MLTTLAASRFRPGYGKGKAYDGSSSDRPLKSARGEGELGPPRLGRVSLGDLRIAVCYECVADQFVTSSESAAGFRRGDRRRCGIPPANASEIPLEASYRAAFVDRRRRVVS